MFNYHKIRTLISELQIKKKSVRIQDIADGMGVVKKSLENYRDGKQQPTADVLERMAIYFEKDVNYFFDSTRKGVEVTQIVASPVEIYEPPGDLASCYKIMYEQQKEITELKLENERLKNVSAPVKDALAG